MTNKLTGKRLEVWPGKEGGGIIYLPAAQVADVAGLLTRHGFYHWAGELGVTHDGVNFNTHIGISQKVDPVAVQSVLDATE